jgi:hypothetical protein
MKIIDPLVTIEAKQGSSGASTFSLAGWSVAAEIIGRLRELSLLTRIDVTAIIGPALSDLDESELDELSRQLDTPLIDSPRGFLQRYLKLRQPLYASGSGPTQDSDWHAQN